MKYNKIEKTRSMSPKRRTLLSLVFPLINHTLCGFTEFVLKNESIKKQIKYNIIEKTRSVTFATNHHALHEQQYPMWTPPGVLF